MAQSLWLRKSLLGFPPAATTTEICKSLYSIMGEMKTQTALAAEVLECLYNPKTTDLLRRMAHADNEEFVLCVIQCIDETLTALSDVDLTKEQLEIMEAIGNTLLHFHYTSNKQMVFSKNRTLLLLSSLSLLNKITTRCPNYAQTHISELLGIAKANVGFGLETEDIKVPQKILPTQNLFHDSSADDLENSAEIEANSHRKGGGRVPKKRKPRALAKSMQNNHQNQQHQFRTQALTLDHIVNDIKTSDSEASELENNASDNGLSHERSALDRQKHAKLRLSAINLLGNVVTRLQERRVLYDYWHAFFENTKIPSNVPQRRSDLLHIALHDPNTRCRATALQIAAQLIFSSKNLLQQAECVINRLPTAFLPFAHSLGLLVVSIFEELTQLLVNESSLPVLTQALKCLSVLVQSTTPFRKFQPRNFIAAFTKEVQRLVFHRDAIIQVAALMVFEFLIAAPELTSEVSNAIGAAYQIRNGARKQHINDENAKDALEIDSSFDEHIDSESEEDTGNVFKKVDENNQCLETASNALIAPSSTCWLLQCVLRNLDASPKKCRRITSIASAASVRIESLQVLAAMAQHFSLLESQLDNVAIALQNALGEPFADLRICAARSLDTIAYQIRDTLLRNTTKPETTQTRKQHNQLEEKCLNFWEKMLPTIMAQIRSTAPDITPAIKVCLCDALSNMGVVIFERQTHAAQMNLIGFLSGIACESNEDAIVQCSAVRALAVYVLFPSLCDNLVFVENAAELALRLIGDTNALVRVKAFWALGNLSDALLINNSSTKYTASMPERISDDLLWRLISAATEACNDNDKVRCNAVRTLGNLLRLLGPVHFKAQNNINGHQLHFQNATSKLIDCLRVNGSAKVKWNTCYAIGNLLQNAALFNNNSINNNFDWQSKLYSALAKVIVHHPNFKVRINAATALTKVTRRTHFGAHYELLWKALLDAIEQSHHLDNFYEYNHRDHLQEQLCLAMSHLLHFAQPEDFVILYKHLKDCAEVLRNTWIRVINRMVPEKSAPIIGCTALLYQQLKDSNANLTAEQQNAISSIIRLFETE